MSAPELAQPQTRRAFAAGLGVAALGTILAIRSVSGQDEVEGDQLACLDEPGVEMLINWADGLMANAGTLDPPVGWQLVSDFNVNLIMIIPPDWEVQVGYAEEFTKSLAPVLSPTPGPMSLLSMYRLISADTRTAYDSASGVFDSITISSALDLAPIARQAVLGENPDSEIICELHIPRPYPNTSTWITAETTRSHMLVTIGEVLQDYTTTGLLTGYSYQAYYAPKRDFEDTVREVYYRFLYQEMQKASGGGDDPTPTPEF